jgi:hypothetical protein
MGVVIPVLAVHSISGDHQKVNEMEKEGREAGEHSWVKWTSLPKLGSSPLPLSFSFTFLRLSLQVMDTCGWHCMHGTGSTYLLLLSLASETPHPTPKLKTANDDFAIGTHCNSDVFVALLYWCCTAREKERERQVRWNLFFITHKPFFWTLADSLNLSDVWNNNHWSINRGVKICSLNFKRSSYIPNLTISI